MVSGKIENNGGWKKLTNSKFSKRHFFPKNTDSSCCGGALLSEEQCKLMPDNVKDDADGNCPKCQKILRENPDLKTGSHEYTEEGISAKPKKVAKDPDSVEEAQEKEPEKPVVKTKEKAKKPAKAQAEIPEKQKKADKPATKEISAKKPPAKTKPEEKPEASKKVEEPSSKADKKEDKKPEKTTKPPKEKTEKPKKEKAAKVAKVREGVPTQVISPFTTVDELVSMSKTLDKAEIRPLVAASSAINNKDGSTECIAIDGDVIPQHAVWNISKNRISSIISDDYSLVQHQDVVKLVGKGLKAIDTEVYGTLKNIEDVVVIEVFFPKLHLKDDARGIDVGGKIINSYNKSRAFKGHMMANRKVCSNGMYLRKLIPDVEFFEIHVGDLAEKIPEMVQDFFSKLKESTAKVNEIIKSAMETTIEFDSEDQVEPTIAGILSSPMHAKRIVDGGYYEAEDKLNPTVWELYNSVTRYISHSGIIESRVDDLSNKAEKILDDKYPIEILDPKEDEESP
jgi:chemotaxis protein histidine kinase CheA